MNNPEGNCRLVSTAKNVEEIIASDVQTFAGKIECLKPKAYSTYFKYVHFTNLLLRFQSVSRCYSKALPADAPAQTVDHDGEFVNDCTIGIASNSSFPTYRVLEPNGRLTDASVLPVCCSRTLENLYSHDWKFFFFF